MSISDAVVVLRHHDITTTPFVGYDTVEYTSRVVGLLVDGKSVEAIEAGQEASVVLESTPFYGEMGGQVGDTGEIKGPSGRFAVTDTVRPTPDTIAHQGNMAEGRLEIGDHTIRMEYSYEAPTDIADGISCLVTQYVYDGTSNRVIKMKESVGTWDSDYDV